VDAKNIHTFTFSYGWQLFSGANSLTLSSARKQMRILKIFKPQFLIFQFSESKFLSRAVVEHIGEVIFIWITSWNSKKKAQQRLLSPLGPQGLTYCTIILDFPTTWSYFVFSRANMKISNNLYCQKLRKPWHQKRKTRDLRFSRFSQKVKIVKKRGVNSHLFLPLHCGCCLPIEVWIWIRRINLFPFVVKKFLQRLCRWNWERGRSWNLRAVEV